MPERRHNDRSLRSRRSALTTVLRNRRLKRALRGFLAFSVAEQGCWLVILLWAYGRGGVGEAGVAAVALLLPAALLAPFVATAADHFPRHRVLTIGFGLTGLSLLGTGTAMSLDAPPAVTYGGALVFSILLTFGGPAVASVMPAAASASDELTAANVVVGLVETFGRLAGPALAGLLLAFGSPGSALLIIGAVVLVGALATIGEGDAFDVPHPDDPGRGSHRTELVAGISSLVRDAQVRGVTVMIVTTSVVAGALDVGAAALAVEALGRSENTTSVIVTSYGVGGLIGAGLTFVLLGRQRLGAALMISVLAMCGSFAVVGFSSSLSISTGLLVVTGAAVTLVSVSGRTMMQGLAHDDRMARVFGVLEGLEAAGLAVGGAVLSFVAVRFGLAEAFAAVGGLGVICLMLLAPRLRSIDAERRPIDPEVISLARSSPIFGPLPPYSLERILHGLVPERFEPGQMVMARGDLGHRMCLVSDGHAVVTPESGDEVVRGRGSHLGEIALLRQTTRTADVRAGNRGVAVYWMDSDTFLAAIDGTPRSKARAEAEATRRLQP